MFSGQRLENSPYTHLLDDALWHEISEMFVKDACALMGLSIESPLSVVVNAGSAALPKLLTIKQVMIYYLLKVIFVRLNFNDSFCLGDDAATTSSWSMERQR